MCSSSLMPIKSLKLRWKVLLTAEQHIISALSTPMTPFQNWCFFLHWKILNHCLSWQFQVLTWNMLGQALNYDLFLHYKFIACGCLSCCNASLHGWQDSTLACFHWLPVADWAVLSLFSGRAREMCWAETKHITLWFTRVLCALHTTCVTATAFSLLLESLPLCHSLVNSLLLFMKCQIYLSLQNIVYSC